MRTLVYLVSAVFVFGLGFLFSCLLTVSSCRRCQEEEGQEWKDTLDRVYQQGVADGRSRARLDNI